MIVKKVQTETIKNAKGYQSVKLYIPNDTLMGLNTKTLENNNKKRRKSKLPTNTYVLNNNLNELLTQ